MLKPGDFAVVVNEKSMKGSGLYRGQEVMLMKAGNAPVKASDPYLFRIYVTVALIGEGDLPAFPTNADEEDDGVRLYTVDPRNLEKVGEDRYKELKDKLEETYGSTS